MLGKTGKTGDKKRGKESGRRPGRTSMAQGKLKKVRPIGGKNNEGKQETRYKNPTQTFHQGRKWNAPRGKRANLEVKVGCASFG